MAYTGNKRLWCHAEYSLFLLITLLFQVGSIPPPYEPLPGPEVWLDSNGAEERVERVKRQTSTTFKYLYTTQCDIFTEKPTNMDFVEVAATEKVAPETHQKAARLLYLMLRFMPKTLYSRMSNKASVGIFAKDEVVGDFPEYSETKNTEACGNRCNGNCRRTCTSDGRKFDNLVGYSLERAVVREDNVLCAPSDPYNGELNVLMHEFAHNIHFYVLGRDFKRHAMLDQAFDSRGNTWGQGYATSDIKEFFSEATTSYFRTSLAHATAAEMNYCGDPVNRTVCPDEFSSRENLLIKDKVLFDLVDELYSGQRTFLEGRVGVCTW